jgi:type IX secretion system PorP/SprF family membrane protein
MKMAMIDNIKPTKMKKLIIYFIFFALAKGYGQELNLPVWTQYLADNNFVVSPTYAGIGDNLKIRANGLTQWVGIKDAPDNQSLYADFRISNQSGIGLSLYNDKNGYTIQTGAKFSFAHHIILDYKSKQFLSFGISYNINNFRIDINEFNTTYEVPVLDPAVTNNRSNSNNNFDVGVLYRYKGYFFSFNANNILKKNIDKFDGIEPSLLLNYQVFSGFTFKTPQSNKIEFEPSVYFQLYSSDKRSSTDLNFKVRKYGRNDDYIWAGLSYRFLNDQALKPLNLGPMFGFLKSKFYFGYSYQITMNDLSGFNSGTHVVTIGLDFFRGISDCPCTRSPIH